MKPEDVKSRHDLAAFIRELVAEFEREGNETTWQNPELGMYLEALSACMGC